MPGLHAEALYWRARGVAAEVVTIVEARGSTPREAGVRMVVAADAVLGSIGGGHLELQAIAHARERLRRPDLPREQQLPLGPSLGQCCGGNVRLRYTPLLEDDPAAWPLPHARFVLQLYGAGHVGRAVVRLLATLPCRVCWIDERDEAFPADALPSHIQPLASGDAVAEAGAAAAGDFHLVMTHSHELDLAVCRAVLQRGDFGWLGLIGSASKRAGFERRLRERGMADAVLQRLVCPVGLPGITGKEPAVIALSVVAQMLQAAGPAAAPR